MISVLWAYETTAILNRTINAGQLLMWLKMKAFGQLITSIVILLWKCGSEHCLIEAYTYSFSIQPTSTEVLNGLAGELKCVFANNIDATQCFWMRNNVPMNIEGRYQYKGTPKNGDCSITITGSTLMQDDAEWVCGMPGNSDVLEPLTSDPPAKYTVLYAPKTPIIKQNGVQIQNGSEINVPNFAYAPKIECKSESGNPGADLQFYLENRSDMLRGNYTLFNDTMTSNKTQTAILQLTEPMDVTWRNLRLACQATHPAYNDTRVYVYIYIRSPYSPSNVVLTADGNTGEVTADAHQQILLFCKSDGYPVPVLSWFTRISADDEWVSYLQYLTGNGTANTSVEAINSQYQCRATCDGYNYYQSNTITINVKGDTSTAQLGLIISIAVAGVVIIVLVAVGICLCCRCRKKRAQKQKTSTRRQQPAGENDPNGSKRYKSNYPVYAYVQNNRNTNIHELDTNSDGLTSDA